ncbi:MAG: DNA repair protein RadA [Oscillospiraceae bacterium]|jgi:DNA repair protein RadA/Sms|nr:DNA repair protein RadA [Oscillospiraceae bacterium]
MSAKSKTVYICGECGYEAVRWAGKCPNCDSWNSFTEEVRETAKPKSGVSSVRESPSYEGAISSIREVDSRDELRFHTGMKELDRVLGGGLVKGSLVLIGGEPGIGKSTLLLQICQQLGEERSILYISGEESRRQIKLRAGRLGVDSKNLYLMTETDIEKICNAILAEKPGIVIIDSIQTMTLETLSSAAGSVTQVRECTQFLVRCAKREEIPVFIVGHVNKDGAIAGPKVLEHIVDAVLYFEGERHQNYRLLRAAKNRFGSTNEIGVFDMTDSGLEEVENPSMTLLSGRPTDVPGTCVSCVLEGTRPILAEVQALVAKTGFGLPRRAATGLDYNRTLLIIAVLEKRAGYTFANLDTYLNVAGGLKLSEPSSDLPIALALVSSLRDKAVGDGTAAFGELGLTGEVRSVSGPESRIREAQRLGFSRCILPMDSLKKISAKNFEGIELLGVRNIREALKIL